MKRALTFWVAAVLALPLIAAEPKTEKKKADDATAQAQPAPAATADSPLVQAAKRSARRKGTTPVITNETLKNSKGHVTTSNTPPAPLEVPKATLGPEGELLAEKRRKEDEKRRQEQQKKDTEKRATEKREKEHAAATEQAEDGVYDDLDTDPAAAEGRAAKSAPKAESKPPVE